MAKSKKQNYSLDTKKKIITATIEELDTVEKEIVQMYINAGYILHKGKKNPWNKKSIKDWLDKKGLTVEVEKEVEKDGKKVKEKQIVEASVVFEDKATTSWVQARKWFFETFKEQIEADKN